MHERAAFTEVVDMRTVIVGASTGLGHSHAIGLAKRGAEAASRRVGEHPVDRRQTTTADLTVCQVPSPRARIAS